VATIQKLGQQRASRVPALRVQIAAVRLQHIEGVKNTSGEPVRLNTARMRSKSEAPSGPQITPSSQPRVVETFTIPTLI
jgi:hypothetical protein